MLIYVNAFMLYIAQLTGAAEKKTSESQQHVQHDVRKTASIPLINEPSDVYPLVGPLFPNV